MRYMIYKQTVYRPSHILANKRGYIRKSRFVLYEKLNGLAGVCNWCGCELTWKTLCADHLDSNIMNDTADNLVGSCRGCNANRDDGTGHGRRKVKNCEGCGKSFLPWTKTRRFCSNKCSQQNRPQKGTKSEHGTRVRYVWGCRCNKCKQANTEYAKFARRTHSNNCHRLLK